MIQYQLFPPTNIYTKIASFRLQCSALTFMKGGIDIWEVFMFMKLILKKIPKKYDSSSIFLYYTYMQLGTTYPSLKSCTYIMFEYFDTIFWTLMFILHSFLTFLKIIILENWNYIISYKLSKYFITFYGRVVLLKLHKFNCQPIFCLSFKTTQVSPNMTKSAI